MIIEDCRLEYDENTGVLYVRSADTGVIVLRISGLPKHLPPVWIDVGVPQMDIVLKYQVMNPYTFNW